MSRWTGAQSAPRWFCLAVGSFFLLRAATTLLSAASFALPGDGWRSVFQLVAVAILAAGLARSRATTTSVAAVAVIYAVATILELVHDSDLFGVIPVDGRDRIVHPLIALLGLACLTLARRAAHRSA